MEVNEIVAQLDVPDIRKFSNKVNEFDDGIDLTIGQPDFKVATNIKKKFVEAIDNDMTTYSHNSGLLELREAVSNYYNIKYNKYYDPKLEVLITNGASEALDSLLRTIVIPGDEVITLSPSYSGYQPLIELSGGKMVEVDTSDFDFFPNSKLIKNAITNKTKAIILNFPTNPTGISLSKGQVDEIVEELKSHDIFIIADEIYADIVFDNNFVSFMEYTEIENKLFTINGLSKSHAMTGLRIGFITGPKKYIQEVLKVHLNNSICANVPSQIAAIEALTNSMDFPIEMTKDFKERRDYLYDALTQLGFKCQQPTGAFYMFPKIPKNIDDVWFAEKLLESKNVAIVPGSSFSSNAKGYIRISYANSLSNLQTAIKRLTEFLDELDGEDYEEVK